MGTVEIFFELLYESLFVWSTCTELFQKYFEKDCICNTFRLFQYTMRAPRLIQAFLSLKYQEPLFNCELPAFSNTGGGGGLGGSGRGGGSISRGGRGGTTVIPITTGGGGGIHHHKSSSINSTQSGTSFIILIFLLAYIYNLII